MSFLRTVRTWSVGAATLSLVLGAAPGLDGDLGLGAGPGLDDSLGLDAAPAGEASHPADPPAPEEVLDAEDRPALDDAPDDDEPVAPGEEPASADGPLRVVDREAFPYGTDLAFEGDLVVAGSGNWDGPEDSGVRLYQRDTGGKLQALAYLHCPSWHADVDFVPDTPDAGEPPDAKPSYVVMSHDSAERNECEPHAGKAGVGVIDVANPSQPAVVGFAETVHGAHNITTVGDAGIVYVSSYGLAKPTGKAGVSVVDVEADPSDPPVTFLEFPGLDASGEHAQLANVSGKPPTSPGCHDIGLDLERDLAFCAGISETQIWDISSPRAPVIVEIIQNPAINVDHGAESNANGDVLVINDEWLGAAGGPSGCLAPREPAGALWFYDIKDPRNAEPLGYWSPPAPEPAADMCTSHFFGTFRSDAGADLLVASWYDHGLWVVDFTDPAWPTAVASFDPEGATFWAAYPYKGHLYANSFSPASPYAGLAHETLGDAWPDQPGEGGLWALDLHGYTAEGSPASTGR